MPQIRLTEKSSVPLGFLITFFAFIATSGVGGVFWLSTLYADVAQAKREISDLKDLDREKTKILYRLDRGLLRIQDKMGIRVPNEAD